MDTSGNPLVTMADEAERPTRWWLAWIVAGVFVGAGLLIGDAVGKAVLGSPAASEPQAQYVAIFMFVTTALLLLGWVRLKERCSFSSLRLPWWVAVVGTSVVMAVKHPGAGGIGTLNIGLYAVFVCLVALQQGSLGPAGRSHELITGGGFGIEASLAGAALLAVVIAIAWVALSRTRGSGAGVTPRASATAS